MRKITILITIFGFIFLSYAVYSQAQIFGAVPGVLLPSQGGTGIGSTTASVGDCLKLLTGTPFRYNFGSCGSGTAGLTNYDAFTHPVVGESATTTILNMAGFNTTASSTVGAQLNVTGLLNASSTILGRGLTLQQNDTIKLGAQTLLFDGTDFVFNDSVKSTYFEVSDHNSETITGSWGININGDTTHPVQIDNTLLIGISAAGETYTAGDLLVNNRIGIGSTTPSTRLSVQGGALIAGTSTVWGLFATGTVQTNNLTASNFRLNNEWFTDLTGTGLDNTGGVLTPNCAAITGSAGLCDGSDDGGASNYDAFPSAATTTMLTFSGGLYSTASTTIAKSYFNNGNINIPGGLTASSTSIFTNIFNTGSSTISKSLYVKEGISTHGGLTASSTIIGGNGLTISSGSVDFPNGSVAIADLAASTISGISLGNSLNALTATNGTLTFSGSYDGSTARTVGLNLGNANTWTASQFLNASTTISPSLYLNGNLNLAGLITSSSTATSTFNGAITALALGAGTTTPLYPLESFSASRGQLALSAGSGITQWVLRNANGVLSFATTTVKGDATSTPDALTIDGNSGSKGLFIGTSTNANATGLAVSGTVFFDSGITTASGLGNALCLSNGQVIQDDSPLTACSGASSRTVKHDIENLSDGLKTILALRPISYIYNESYTTDQSTHLGFVAEEVLEIEPRLVDVPTKGNLLGLKYNEFVVPIVSAIQDIWKKLTSHESRIEKLEKENAELKARIEKLEK